MPAINPTPSDPASASAIERPFALATLPGRWWLAAVTAMAIGLLLLLSFGLLANERENHIEKGQAQAQREVKRLAAEFDQSLRLAKASMLVVARSPWLDASEPMGDQRPLVEALNLPFELRPMAPDSPLARATAPGQWTPGLPQNEAGRWYLPLGWRQPPADGGRLFELRLAREAILQRFASEVIPAGSSMSLFRFEDDGGTTVLVRYPLIESEQGRTIRGHIAQAIAKAPEGVFQAKAVLDGVHRVVAYQRLGDSASRLVVVYALSTQGLLAGWNAVLPWALAATLLVAAALAYGARRLDRSMRALRRSERHFQTLTSHLPDVVARYDRSGRALYVNPAVENANGLKPEAIIGRRFADIGAPESIAATWMDCLARVFGSGQSETLCFTYPGPMGLRHWESQVSLEPAAHGEEPTVLVITRDITERQSANAERERLSQFILILVRLASRFINLPVQQMDEAIDRALREMGEFVSADRAYLFSYDFAEQTASNTHEWCASGITPQKDGLQNLPTSLAIDWAEAHQRGEMLHVPDVQALPAGRLREILEPQGIRSLMTLPLTSTHGCLGFVGFDSVRSTHRYGDNEIVLLQLFAQILVNLKERSDSEQRLRELTGRLEQKVAERTSELETNLKRLQTVNRELESFTYSASHDLRTPLRGIEGFSALLLQDHASQLNEEGRGYLQRIQRATMHMSQLINDLLAYAHLEEMTGRMAPVNLAELVSEVLAPLHHALESRQARVSVEIPEGLQVRADSKGLGMALRNLIDNALKFTPAERAPEIRIEAQDQDGTVHLQVADRGLGFDMKHHDLIFGMFQRLHRQDQIPGTGIGLAMVHKAVERMGGHIRADSAPGQGSSFHIELPRG